MNKILLIIQREFLNRVQKKSFLLVTLLVPLLFPSIIGGMAYFVYQNAKNAEKKTIDVVDESGLFTWKESSKYQYVLLDTSLKQAKKNFNESEHFALIYIPAMELESPEGITFYSKNSPGVSLVSDFEHKIEQQIRDIKLTKSGISEEMLASLKSDVSIEVFNFKDGEEKKSDSTALFVVGYLMSFLIYIFLIVYGVQVMQGVIEEKNSKIIEVIISTVKPFHLMMGKIIGIASVGIAQFCIWIIFITGISAVTLSYFGMNMPEKATVEEVMHEISGEEELQATAMDAEFQKVVDKVSDIPIVKILLLFLFYFLGGYLLYGALFATIGSAVDTPTDAQQFMLPIMLPIVVAIISLPTFIFEDPHSSMSFWLSTIPLTSPIVMMGRIGFGVPWWELALSMTLLVAGFTFTVWMAARIYRIGILMHGVKVNYKVLAKWFIMKN